MQIFLYNFHQGGKYSSQLAIYQAELRRDKKFTDQKSLSISSLQSDYLNLYSSSGSGEIVRKKILSRQSAIVLKVPTILQKMYQKDQKGELKIS